MDATYLESKSLTEIVMNRLIQLIIDNKMKAGDRLPNEYQLAEQLNVGRSTLREAIRLLVSRNILEVRRGAGTFVSQKRGVPEDPLGLTFRADTPRLAVELFEIRLMIEPVCVSMAAIHATEAQRIQLEQCCCAVEKKIEDNKSYFEADEAFHSYLAELSGNSVLKTLVPIIVSSIYMTTVSTADQFRNLTYQQHRKILNCVLRQDGIGAALAMSEHLNTNREYFANNLEEEKKRNYKEKAGGLQNDSPDKGPC